VSANPDDDALTWAGDTDSTHAGSMGKAPKSPPVKSKTQPKTATTPATTDAGKSDGAAGTDRAAGTAQKPTEQPPMSSIVLLSLGILGGVYLLYTVGWIVTVQRNANPYVDAFDQLAFSARQYLAIAAPALWFAVAFLLTRRGRAILLLLWLIVGVVVLVPWPFVLGK
jgi:hypothetical protein